MSQTFRSMIHSRLELGMKQYERSYPDTAIVLIEPDHRDAELFLANTFSYRQRRELAEHAYQQTRQWLRSQYTSLSHRLHPHGITLDRRVLDDNTRHLLTSSPENAADNQAQPTNLSRRDRLNQALHRLQNSVDDLNHALAHHAIGPR